MTKDSSFSQRCWHKDALDKMPVGKMTCDLLAQRQNNKKCPTPWRRKSAQPRLWRLAYPTNHQETDIKMSKQEVLHGHVPIRSSDQEMGRQTLPGEEKRYWGGSCQHTLPNLDRCQTAFSVINQSCSLYLHAHVIFHNKNRF